jgi:hypothetical protein
MEVFSWDPFVVCWEISFPSYKILLLFPPTVGMFFDDLFDFPFQFAFHDIGRWL